MTFGFHREQWSELPPLTIHPCRNPLLPPGIYTNGTPSYIYPHPCATLCALRRHAEWNELSNQLGFKPIASRDGSYAVATHTRAWRKSVRATCTYYICVYIYMFSREISSPFTFSCLFFPFFLSYFSARQIKGTHVATVLRVSLAFCSGSPREWPRDRKSRCVVDVLLSSKNFLFNFFSQVELCDNFITIVDLW